MKYLFTLAASAISAEALTLNGVARSRNTTMEEMDYEPFENPDISKKYEDLATVNEVLFMIACRTKHTEDVEGLAKERVRKEKGLGKTEMDSKAFMAEVEKIHGENVQDMKKTCGLVNGSGWKRCRAGCTERHAKEGADTNVDAKEVCTALCEKKYKNYETECEDQAANLKNVYETNRVTMQAGTKCSDLHCPDFPNIVTAAEEDQQGMLDEQCKKQCEGKAEGEKAGCEKKCADECNLNNLGKCGKDFSKNLNITVDYCTQLWKWMYESEEIDPRTGNPVVF